MKYIYLVGLGYWSSCTGIIHAGEETASGVAGAIGRDAVLSILFFLKIEVLVVQAATFLNLHLQTPWLLVQVYMAEKQQETTPSAMNVAARDALFWDGRAATLEEQALGPIENPNEMNLPLDVAIERLNNSKYKGAIFKSIWQKP